LLKQQLSIAVYRLATKENKLPFPYAANKLKFAKATRFSLTRLPFAHRANGSLSVYQTEGIHVQRTCPYQNLTLF
jgi:hypothetical protein